MSSASITTITVEEPIPLEPLTTTTVNTNFDPADPDNIFQASRLADSQVPDGGYGWVVIFASAVMAFWSIGTVYTWGVIQAALVAQNVSSAATLSFVGGLAGAGSAFYALINSRLIQWIGARKCAILGIALNGFAMVCSGFSTHNVAGLFVCYGVIGGAGTSLCFLTMSSVPTQYFNKKRGLANGIVYAGGGLGGTIMSLGIDQLIKKLGVEWSFRIVGLMTLATGLPAAYLMKERAPIRTNNFVEWRLFKNLQFSILFIATAIGTFPLLVPPFFLPLYSTSLGLSSSAGSALVAGFNLSSALGRLSCGFSSDIIGPVNTLFIALGLSAASMLVLWPVSNSLGPLIAFVIINGISNGGFFACMPTVVGNVFGSARVGVALSMIVSGWAGGYLMGAPIAGYLLAAYGGPNSSLKAYHPAIFYAGGMALAATILVAAVRVNIDRRLFKKI